MKRKRSLRSLTRATGLLALGNALNRFLGMAYRMILSRFLGAEGLGLFQMAMSLYFAILSPFISGLPTALSQVVAGWRTEGISPHTRHLVVKVTVLTLLLLAVAATLALATDWTPPGENWGLAKQLVPLPLLLPAIGLAVVSASLRGVFLGRQEVAPVVRAQLQEQMARLLMIGGILAFPAAAGWALGLRLELVLWNLVLGELITCLLLVRAYRQALAEPWVIPRSEGTPPRLRTVLRLAGPVAIQRVLSSAERLAEATLIPAILQRAGAPVAAAVAAYGELTGMALPLLYLPNVFVHALTHTLVPGVAEVLDQQSALHHRIGRALALTAEIGALTALGLAFTGDVLMALLFGADPAAPYPYAGRTATLLAPLAALIYVDHVAAAILRGLDRATAPLVVDLVGLGVRLGMLLWLGLGRGLGMPAVAAALTASVAVMCLLEVALTAWYAGLPLERCRPLLHATIAAVAGYAGGRVLLLVWEEAAIGAGQRLLALGAAVAVYGLVRLGAPGGAGVFGWRAKPR
ncbi:MAG TPA: oligosaccharide flippase family protein [Bacillota bacterium]